MHSYLNALVPDAPQVNLISVYSSDSQALTNLMIEICSQMVRVCLKGISNINLTYYTGPLLYL